MSRARRSSSRAHPLAAAWPSGVELLEAAVGRILVLAPAQHLGPVADPAGAHMVETHLDHELRAQADPLEIAVGRPAARLGRAALAGFVRPQPADQVALLLGPEARGMADDAQVVAVVEAEDQRAHGAL